MRVSALCILAAALVARPLAAQQEPPRRLDFSQDSAAAPADTLRETTRAMRNVFVRNQTVLGVTSYAPAFAAMIGTSPTTRLAGYLVMAGGTFFIANELTRQMEITPAREVLSSRMAWRGTLSGLALGISTSVPPGEVGALTLLGGVVGAGAGLAIGGELTEGEAVATVVGHDLMALSSLAITYIADPSDTDGSGLSGPARVVIPMVAGWGGYALGRLYAGRARYEVTAGDALLLWLGAGIGAAGASAFIAESGPSTQAITGTMLLGGAAGVWASDRLLVRTFDHTRGEGAFVGLGAAAGSLMGIGTAVLVSGTAERSSSVTLAFGTLGAIGGAWLTERSQQPAQDEGRRMQVGARRPPRVQVTPTAALAAAAGVQGAHPIVRITF